MKYFLLIAAIFFSSILYGGAVFLKDGTLVEGRILNENSEIVILWQRGSGKKTFKKKNLLRILYHDNYKKKVFIYLLNGSYIEGYIVDEDNEVYVYRLVLKKGNEKTIDKKYVNFISYDSIVQKGFAPYRKYNPWGMWYFGFEMAFLIPLAEPVGSSEGGSESDYAVPGHSDYTYRINSIRPIFVLFSSPAFKWHAQVSFFYGGNMTVARAQGGYNFQLLPDTLTLTLFGGLGYEQMRLAHDDGTGTDEYDDHVLSLTAGVSLPWNIIRGRGLVLTVRYSALFYSMGVAHVFETGITCMLY